jgi:hypothetical protein
VILSTKLPSAFDNTLSTFSVKLPIKCDKNDPDPVNELNKLLPDAVVRFERSPSTSPSTPAMTPWIMLASESPVGQADEDVAVVEVVLAADRELALALEFVLFVEAVTVKPVGLGAPASAVELYNGEVALRISSLLLAAFCTDVVCVVMGVN